MAAGSASAQRADDEMSRVADECSVRTQVVMRAQMMHNNWGTEAQAIDDVREQVLSIPLVSTASSSTRRRAEKVAKELVASVYASRRGRDPFTQSNIYRRSCLDSPATMIAVNITR